MSEASCTRENKRCAQTFYKECMVRSGCLTSIDSGFYRFQNAELRSKSKKWSPFKYKVSYLGYVITEKGVETDPQNVKCKHQPIWVTNADFWIYALTTGGSWRNSPPLPILCIVLHKKTSTEYETAFQDLKRMTVTSPILALPDFSKQFFLDTATYGSVIGAVLSQIVLNK